MAHIEGLVGARIDAAESTKRFPLGTKASGTSGTEWIYVQAAVAINAYDMVTYTSVYQASGATTTSASTEARIGVAQHSFAASDYGFIAVRGDALTVNVSATNQPSVQLYIASTTGKLSSTSSSGTLQGMFLNANVSSTAGVTLGSAFVNFPNYRVL
jgi:hypothetical protein